MHARADGGDDGDGGENPYAEKIYRKKPFPTGKIHLFEGVTIREAARQESDSEYFDFPEPPEDPEEITSHKHLATALCGRDGGIPPYTPVDDLDPDDLDPNQICRVCLRAFDARRSGED